MTRRRMDPTAVRTRKAAMQSAAVTSVEANKRVVDHLRARGALGSTDEEGYLATGLNRNTYPPARTKLYQSGIVVSLGITRPTSSGKQATVWALASCAPEGVGKTFVEHSASPRVETRGGTFLQVCRRCGVPFPEPFRDYEPCYQFADTFHQKAPAGARVIDCRSLRVVE